jgi:hypothetical protein
MILHLALDEKFIDDAFKDFEYILPGKNILAVFSNTKKLKYIKYTKANFILNPSIFNPQRLLKKIGNIDLIISYSLFPSAIRVISYANSPVLWLGFGYDYYTLISENQYSLFLNKTASLYNEFIEFNKLQNKTLKSRIKQFIKILISIFTDNKQQFSIPQLIQSEKINFFAPVIKPEYDLLKSKLMLDKFPEYTNFSFGSSFASNEEFYSKININGKNILLGNSASFTNNHIEAIDIIAKNITNKDRKIITPLSYGDEFYKNKINLYGKKNLGSSFEPILDFMDKQDYYLKISSCSVCIMNHLRQQALGNISMMLFWGAKVFLNNDNILYKYLKDSGFFVYPIDDICRLGDIALADLSENEKKTNRDLVKKIWSRDAILNKIKKLIEQTGIY